MQAFYFQIDPFLILPRPTFNQGSLMALGTFVVGPALSMSGVGKAIEGDRWEGSLGCPSSSAHLGLCGAQLEQPEG